MPHSGGFAPIYSLLQGGNAATLPLALGRACVQGGLFVLAVAAICRLFPRLPAALRFWLWWLACVKLLASLFCIGLFPLPIPTLHIAVPMPALSVARPLLIHSLAVPSTPPTGPLPVNVAEESRLSDAATAPARQARPMDAPIPDNSVPAARLFTLLYAAGVLIALARTLSGAKALRRLLRGTEPVIDPALLKAARDVAARFRHNVSHLRLRESAQIASPLVAGILRPILVLPAGFAQAVNPAQIRLALAHEMAHLRRRDLLLGLVPGAARILFWFFPPAAIAARECGQACEEVCDARALALCPGPRSTAEYGQLLLLLSAGRSHRAALPNALGMAATPGYARLKRRLNTLRRGARPLGPAARRLALLVAALFGAAALPWRLTAFAALERERPKLPQFPTLQPLPHFEVVNLGTLGGTYSDALAISDDGRIVGAANVTTAGSGRGHAFVYDSAISTMTDLGTSPFRRSIAVGVNQQGAVTGLAFNRATRPQIFLWNGRQRRFLDTLPGFRYAQAAGISDKSTIAGTALDGRDPINGTTRARAILYRDGRLHDLGTLGGPYSYASAITPSGIVVGKADLPRPLRSHSGSTHAFVSLPNAVMRDLGVLPGGTNSRAWGANHLGEVVGFSETGEGAAHAFLVPGNSDPMHDLGTLPEASSSVAYAVSDTGWIVGAASLSGDTDAEDDTRAVLWIRTPGEAGGRLVNLNDQISEDSGWTLEVARGINRHGWIVGQGRIHGKQQAFLLKPLPK